MMNMELPSVRFDETILHLQHDYLYFSKKRTDSLDDTVAYLGKIAEIHDEPWVIGFTIIRFEWLAEQEMHDRYIPIHTWNGDHHLIPAFCRFLHPDHLLQYEDASLTPKELLLDFFQPHGVPEVALHEQFSVYPYASFAKKLTPSTYVWDTERKRALPV